MPVMTTHVLITGHSRGLGAALYTHAHDQGMKVMGISSREVNFADPKAVDQFLETKELESFFAGASQALLINNAGRLLPVGMTGQLGTQDILSSIAVNVGAALAIANAFVAATQGCADRRIAQISSGAARSPYAGWSIYCASKAALDQHARCVAMEGHTGLRIESVAPGIIDTDMQGQVRATTVEQFPMRPKFDKLKAEGALASPASVAEKLLAHLQNNAFGQQTCTDLRQLS
jgi:benzil reductase ((S)-benzoin forming)